MENLFLSNKVFASTNLFVILIISGCLNSPASRDFSSDFKCKIDSIEKYIPVSVENPEFRSLGMYLHEMTGHFPTSEDKRVTFRIDNRKDSIIYSRINFENNKKLWLNWLRKNKSKYTLEYSDSVYNRFYEVLKSMPPTEIYDY